jgi:hypothetical protein
VGQVAGLTSRRPRTQRPRTRRPNTQRPRINVGISIDTEGSSYLVRSCFDCNWYYPWGLDVSTGAGCFLFVLERVEEFGFPCPGRVMSDHDVVRLLGAGSPALDVAGLPACSGNTPAPPE